MVALLAGTRTSPERKFPSHAPLVTDGQAEAGRELNDRRAVTAVLNALLSIFGSGAATWWAAEKLYWKDEWCSHLSAQKVLLALLVAIAVATSEVVLYLIWDARRSDSSSKTASRRALTPRHTPLSGVPSRDPTHSTGEPAQPSATLIVDNQSSTDIPYMPGANDPNVQQYRTADGLRERTVGHN
ncbi:hypothetical protein PHLCEN_2v2443 [Hermanssonia centrifuga]|uniref:Uncharacterized protein n=1 Tax=Hermanssonia centrifuga TaxID=98765 RepID=A0A2R6RLX5_9APHY|nr:hypothetical protein PHLCEN_2v2443 [Hermanssonia centrifuga]